jgi:hypothetical protein
MGHETTKDFVPWEEVYKEIETNPGTCKECNGQGVLIYNYPKGVDENDMVAYEITEEPCPRCSKY